MGFSHYQACVPYSDTTLNEKDGVSYDSSVIVYDTMFSYPSTGIEYFVDNIDNNGDITGLDRFDILGGTSGTIPSLVEDWVGGGPASADTNTWQTTYQGLIYGGVKGNNTVSIKVIYSGSVKLSVVSDNIIYSGTGELADVLLDDWVLDNSSSSVKEYTSTVVTSATADTYGVLPFRLRYWNSTNIPHLVVKIKRHGIDDDFILLSTSSITNLVDYDFNLDEHTINDACSNQTLPDVLSWSISKTHENITVATINAFIENTSDNNSYNYADESFGSIRKGQLISIHAGYDGSLSKRFVGNVTGGIEVSREAHGSIVSFKCEGITALMLDTKNYSFPNNASYSLAEYFTGDYDSATPNGTIRPAAYDKWNITTAVKTLALQSGIDPSYLETTRKYYTDTMDTIESDYSLIRDYNIFLSSKLISEYARTNVNISLEESYIWTYDFGQDSAYDMAKDMLKKYGFYLTELGAGEDCGSLSIVEVDSPLSTTENIDSGVSYTENILKEYAEGFRVTELASGTSSVIYNWTGKSVSAIIPRHQSFTSILQLEYKVSSSDMDWTSVLGTYNQGVFNGTNSVYPIKTDATNELHFYNGTNNDNGGNTTLYNLVFGVENNGDIKTALPYGDHQLRFFKTTSGICYIDSIIAYDYDQMPYKRYSTDNLIQSLTVTSNIPDIRNDIVVLGASSAGFSHVADPEDLVEVSNKFITSRAVDHRSIYDKTYKYYVGRNKKFVIEDPTIVTQERADWLSSYVLEEYRQTSRDVGIKIPADSGLQLYNSITVNDVKTDSINSDLLLLVTSITESYSSEGYSMSVSASSRSIPPSFRSRQTLTQEELGLYFNNCPIAFEKVTVPISFDNTAYDPMTSDDGQYIKFEWTQLVPGSVSIELFDVHGGERVGTIGSSNNLVAVPYLNSEVSTPGKYVVLWDGVHEGWDLNDKFTGTLYETVYERPEGHGFFARGQDTPLVDLVDPVSFEAGNLRASKVLTFPLFALCKYNATSSEYENVVQNYKFGTYNGTSVFNGVQNTLNSESALDIEHFQLAERIALVWDFDENHINYPTDAEMFNRNYVDPYEVEEKYGFSETYTQDDIDYNDISHKTLNYDYKTPHGYDGTWAPHDKAKTLYTMPVIDQTVAVRLFTDTEYTGARKFYIHQSNFIYTVVTVVTDTVNYNLRRFSGWQGNNNYRRVQNYVFNQSTPDGQPMVDLKNTEQFIEFEKWTTLPSHLDRSNDNSLLFRGDFSKISKVLDSGLNSSYTNTKSTIEGLGVGKTLALSTDNIKKFDVGEIDTLINPSYYIPYEVGFEYGSGGLHTSLNLTNQFLRHNPDEVFSSGAMPQGDDVYLKGTSNHHVISTLDRKVYNTVLISIDMIVIDRAGRAYYSLAKQDSGRFLVGDHNDIQVHTEYGLELLKYVNRYNPYLPTACYMEDSPASLDMTEFGGERNSLFTTERVGHLVDYEGINLSTKVINHTVTSNNDVISATRPDPIKYLNWYDYHNPALNGLPVMTRSHQTSGQDSGFFGSILNKYNSYVYIPTSVPSGQSRGNIIDEPSGPYGIPLYISGGHTCGNTNVYSSYPTNPYIDRYTWTQNYIKDNYDGQGQVDEVKNQRSGLWSWINNMPVFTFLGGARLTNIINRS